MVTLSPSLRPALEVVLEVDTYDDSRGRHVRPEVVTYEVSRDGTRTLSLDSTRLAPEAWLGIASYVHQVQTC